MTLLAELYHINTHPKRFKQIFRLDETLKVVLKAFIMKSTDLVARKVVL